MSSLETAVTLLHAHNAAKAYKAALVVVGGGHRVISDLLNVPGGSAWVLDAAVPYATAAMHEYLHAPAVDVAACSRETAWKLASAARSKCVAVEAQSRVAGKSAAWLHSCMGVACTAALVSSTPKKGLHRAHIAAVRGPHFVEAQISLEKNVRRRDEEDDVVSRAVMAVTAVISGAPVAVRDVFPLDVHMHGSDEELSDIAASRVDCLFMRQGRTPLDLTHLRERRHGAQFVVPAETKDVDAIDCMPDLRLPTGSFVVPGSFNPLHAGHLEMSAAAASLLHPPLVCLELAAVNVDKPSLTPEDLARRARQFVCPADEAVLHPCLAVTTTAKFVDKAALFPGCTFVLGIDTVRRLVDPKYYGNSHDAMVAALSAIRDHGCKFVVGGRLESDGRFLVLRDIQDRIPEGLGSMFIEIPEDLFRNDISSTQLRAAAAAAAAAAAT